MVSNTWLQSFTGRKVLAYFLIQLFTLSILSAYPLNMLALFSISIAMPLVLEMSVRFTGFILGGIASLFARRTRPVTPPTEGPEPEEKPEPESRPRPWTSTRIDRYAHYLQINQAIIAGNRDLAIQLFNQMPISDPYQLRSLCNNAIRCNASAIFERMIALPEFQTHLADSNNQLLGEATFHQRITMVNALLRNSRVRDLAHVDSNRALRLACTNGSLAIVEALLRLPNVVRQLQGDSDHIIWLARRLPQRDIEQRLLALPVLREHHRRDFNVRPFPFDNLRVPDTTPNLRDLANNRESAMASLNPQHQQQIGAIQIRYAQAFAARGVEGIINDLRAFLVQNYQQNPVMHNGRALPLEYNAALSPDVQALYYANKAHTAYRYLCIPNPWISPAASYSERLPSGGASARIYPDDKIVLAYLWLAACDTSVPAPDGMTHADLKKLFAETILAGAGRGHNYDNAQLNERAGREIDDGLGDNPTCGTGASRWISQFLTLLVTDPSSRALNSNILLAKCRDILIAEGTNEHTVFSKLRRFDKATLTATKTALENLISEHEGNITALNESERNLIGTLKPSQTAITAMLQECKDYFGEARITARGARERISFQGTRYQSYEDVLQFIGDNLIQTFGNEIRTKIIELETPTRSSKRVKAR